MRRARAAILAAAALLAGAALLVRPASKPEPSRRSKPVSTEEGVPGTADPGNRPVPAPSVESQAARARVPTVDLVKPGIVRGRVRLAAAPPRQRPIPMEADPACVALHAERPLQERVVVDSELGVRWAFVHVVEGALATDPPPIPVSLRQEGCRYVPHVLGIQVGQPLAIENNDPLLHNIHALPFANAGFNLGQVQGSPAVTRFFHQEEVMVKVACDVHPWMTAWVGVLPHPYYGVTDDAGRYQLPALAPGRYTVGVWHEAYEQVNQAVEVFADQTTALEFVLDRRK